jgi:magnesium-transporting ATPase (P-type)
MIADLLIGSTLITWFANVGWTDFTKLFVAFSFIKRIYSIANVHVTFIRFRAVQSLSSPISGATKYTSKTVLLQHSLIYTSIYAVLSLTTAIVHVYSYVINDWDSKLTRDSDSFKYGHKFLNLVATSWFVVLGIVTDIMFIMVARRHKAMMGKLGTVRAFYNYWISLSIGEFIIP